MTTADDFRRLHAEGVLVLPNAWDAASARLVERAGAAAVATTSGAVAWSLGVPDGDRLPLELLAGAVERIAAAVAVPVTADVESGGPDVAATVRAVLDAGAVGINIEDGGGAVEPHRDRVAAASEAGGRDLFVNARIDLYLFGIGEPDGRLAETIARAGVYAEAGADGIFVPGVTDLDVLRRLVAEIPRRSTCWPGRGRPRWTSSPRSGCAGSASAPAWPRRPTRRPTGPPASCSPPGPTRPSPAASTTATCRNCSTSAVSRDRPGRRPSRPG